MDNRHAFRILEQLGPEADRLGIKVVDAYGQSGPVSEFLPEIIRYIEAREAEIDRLREAIRRLAEQDATLSVCNGNVTVTMDATLTDEEREAIERLAIHCANTSCVDTAKTLWGLLERTSAR
jgi:hypothetical protein